MADLNRVMLVLHFVGLAMGLSMGLSMMVMGPLMAKATPAEQLALARFPPLMSRLSTIGLALLWLTGLWMLYNKWDGFSMLPWTFQAKITGVVLLTLLVGFIHWQQRLAQKGDPGAAARIKAAGMVTPILALIIIVFAVMTFD